MKKVMLFAVAALALLTGSQDAHSGPYSVEPCIKSRLCGGLVDHFTFEESSDSARYGAYGSALLEVPGYNLSSTTGKSLSHGSNAANFGGTAASDYLWSSTFLPPMSSNWSMAFYFRTDTLPSSSPTDEKALVSRRGQDGGPEIVLSGNSPNTKLCLYTLNREGTSQTATCTASSISTATTYFVAAGVGDDDDTPGALKAWVSLNGNSKETSTLNYLPYGGLNHLRVGQRPDSGKGATGSRTFDGWIDELSIFGRSIGPTDISLLYNGGTGRTYPFVTE